MTIGDNLTRFRASPDVPRLAVALFVGAAVMLAALASTGLPNPDNVGDLRAKGNANAAASVPSTPARLMSPTPLGCTKLYRGQWIRGEIAHRGDVEPYRLECWYGYGPQWEAL